MSEKLILQVTGEADAGKTEVCRHLSEQYGFSVVLISDMIRGFAQSKGINLGPRKDYLAAHRQMKDEQGVDIVARTILAEPSAIICVDGIRVVNDVVRVKEAPGVVSKLIALHCPPEIRFERALTRQSPLDSLTYEEFCAADLTDAYNPDPERQNTHAVMEMADYHVDSSRSAVTVFRAIDSIVVPLLGNTPPIR